MYTPWASGGPLNQLPRSQWISVPSAYRYVAYCVFGVI